MCEETLSSVAFFSINKVNNINMEKQNKISQQTYVNQLCIMDALYYNKAVIRHALNRTCLEKRKVIPSCVSGRGYEIGSVCLYVCVCHHSHS